MQPAHHLLRAARSALICATVLLLLWPERDWSQSFGPYLKIDGGVNFVPDTDFEINGSSGTMSLDSGFRVDGTVGYEFGRWLAVEVEGGLAENSISKLTLGQLFTHPPKSSLTEIPVLANVVVRYENPTDFVPYIGAGAGAVMSTLQIAGDKDEANVLAWQGKLGVIYKIDDQAWLDLSYKLLSTGEQEYLVGPAPVRLKEVFNHFFGLSVIWKF